MQSAKGIAVYLLLAFGIAWIAWETPLRAGVPIQSIVFMLAGLPGAFAPAIAAFVVRKWITREGFADAGLRPNLRRWRYYLVAWLLPLPLVAAIVGLAALLAIGQPDFTLQRAQEAFGAQNVQTLGLPPMVLWPLLVVQTLIGAVILTPILWGEEFGWRGYLQLRVLPGQPVAGAVVTGLIWGLWHAPLLLRGHNFPNHPYLGLAIFPIGTTQLSIILGWLRLRTGSVWAPSLAHAALNAVAGPLTLLLFVGGPDFLFVNPLGVLGWIPLGILAGWIVLTGRLRPQAEPVRAPAPSGSAS